MRVRSKRFAGGVLIAAAALYAAPASAQGFADAAGLPDAPTPTTAHRHSIFASPEEKLVPAGEIGPHLTVGNKVLMGIRSSVSPIAGIGWVFDAGYEQAIDADPHYGETGKGFVQRLGAAAARATSENILNVSVLAPILHQDPRYYVMGRRRNPVVRVGYALTRSLITRTDDGRATLNSSQIGANLIGSAMTQLYYPPGSRGLGKTFSIFAGSMEGAALGSVVREFFGTSKVADKLKGSQAN